MGLQISQFDIPVCNIFRETVFHDQLCYEVDLNQFKFKDKRFKNQDTKLGLSFIVDTNEVRQTKSTKYSTQSTKAKSTKDLGEKWK